MSVNERTIVGAGITNGIVTESGLRLATMVGLGITRGIAIAVGVIV